MERCLIINADDYGVSLSANQAVEHLFDEGFLTSATLMTPCPWATEALHRAKNNKKMRVGLHLTFNAEYPLYKWGPVCRNRTVGSLLDENGFFYDKVPPLLQTAKSEDITAEMEAQYEFMTRQGIRPTHMDNHMGSVYGLNGRPFLKETFAFCAKHHLNFRLPRSAKKFAGLPEELKDALSGIEAEVDGLGIGIPDDLFSHPNALTPNDTYETVRDYYLNRIRSIDPGITEMFLHPARETEELKAICGSWQKRVWEYRLMLDDTVFRAIESEGIRLVGWTDAPFKTDKKHVRNKKQSW
ncbi:polysaccharide deacetylase family protein [Eubacteriales bacterium mix99]|jgi:hypothetical protein|nr:hypothetical protein [Clostridiales bacterium]